MSVWQSVRGETEARQSYRPLQDGLRVAGRYLDRRPGRLRSLCIVHDGVVFALAGTDDGTDRLSIMGRLPHDDLAAGARIARGARGHGERHDDAPDPLFPTGYEDFLRAFGGVAATRAWEWPRVTVLDDSAVLRYSIGHARRQMALVRDDIHTLLNRAYRDRGHTAPGLGLQSWPGPLGVPVVPSGRASAVPVARPDSAGRYRHACGALAVYLASVQAQDVLIQEAADGFMVVYLTPRGTQEADLLTIGDLSRHARRYAGALRRLRLARGRDLVREVRLLGEHLDRCGARAVSAQSLGGGAWSLECDAMFTGGHGEPRIGRTQTLFMAC